MTAKNGLWDWGALVFYIWQTCARHWVWKSEWWGTITGNAKHINHQNPKREKQNINRVKTTGQSEQTHPSPSVTSRTSHELHLTAQLVFLKQHGSVYYGKTPQSQQIETSSSCEPHQKHKQTGDEVTAVLSTELLTEDVLMSESSGDTETLIRSAIIHQGRYSGDIMNPENMIRAKDRRSSHLSRSSRWGIRSGHFHS